MAKEMNKGRGETKNKKVVADEEWMKIGGDERRVEEVECSGGVDRKWMKSSI